jgi:hypothetical protein
MDATHLDVFHFLALGTPYLVRTSIIPDSELPSLDFRSSQNSKSSGPHSCLISRSAVCRGEP